MIQKGESGLNRGTRSHCEVSPGFLLPSIHSQLKPKSIDFSRWTISPPSAIITLHKQDKEKEEIMSRLVCWYSHGAASLMAAKKAIEMQPELYPDHEIVVASIYIKNEYQEPERDALVEKFLGYPITHLRNEKYNANVDTVIEKTRYMSGVYGARCTKELKKAVRLEWQQDDDVHVFGFDCNEASRIDNVLDTEPELEIFAPLVELGITKAECFPIIKEAGIPIPKMYELGYHNNNCVGCLKAAGAGYWNKIRKDFPEVFARRAHQEEMLNTALVSMSRDKLMKKYPDHYNRMVAEWEDRYKTRKVKTKAGTKDYHTSLIPLRFLPEDAGSFKDLDIGDCGFVCEMK